MIEEFMESIVTLLSQEWLISLFAMVFSFGGTYWALPRIISRVKAAGLVGRDVNKPGRPEVPELGGIAAILSISLSLMVVSGGLLLFDIVEPMVIVPVYAAMSVMFITAFVGLIDDLAILRTKAKVIFTLFAAMPLVVMRHVDATILLPFIEDLLFETNYLTFLFFWIIITPIAITACANAFNMSAGYNGLESGQVLIVSLSLLIVSFIMGVNISTILIFSGLVGCNLVLYYYNRYPAKVFIGDVGTLSMGALVGVGVITGAIQLYGVICIIPMFYEAYATIYYRLKGVGRREKCHNPQILEDGRLKPPEGAEGYTLFYYLLSKKPMTEKHLVEKVLAIYAICGCLAIMLSVLHVTMG
jgi:UDP-N-acetylglucosamine--dolichyl-phosphate N-acetylglucosaminephosphotransferase